MYIVFFLKQFQKKPNDITFLVYYEQMSTLNFNCKQKDFAPLETRQVLFWRAYIFVQKNRHKINAMLK